VLPPLFPSLLPPVLLLPESPTGTFPLASAHLSSKVEELLVSLNSLIALLESVSIFRL
jgi:hypothetical protein